MADNLLRKDLLIITPNPVEGDDFNDQTKLKQMSLLHNLVTLGLEHVFYQSEANRIVEKNFQMYFSEDATYSILFWKINICLAPLVLNPGLNILKNYETLRCNTTQMGTTVKPLELNGYPYFNSKGLYHVKDNLSKH